MNEIIPLLKNAIDAREALFEAGHKSACRVFNGFYEGEPNLVIDLYASTLVVYNHAEKPEDGEATAHTAVGYMRERLPWLRAGVIKRRNSSSLKDRKGELLFGEPDRKVKEFSTWYALDLFLDQDASLFLDTRNLRRWAAYELVGKTVLNTFAYTGSLGVAACAGGARLVVQTDLNREALNLAKTSYSLNGFSIHKPNFITGDFWTEINQFKRIGELFDCVILDPPYFSVTSKGVVDLEENTNRVINKVRPLVEDGGRLVAVNNALYVSGKAYMEVLEKLCADGYLKILELIPVPEDFTGYPETRVGKPITAPAPFNHSTKIAVLEVRRKSRVVDEIEDPFAMINER